MLAAARDVTGDALKDDVFAVTGLGEVAGVAVAGVAVLLGTASGLESSFFHI